MGKVEGIVDRIIKALEKIDVVKLALLLLFLALIFAIWVLSQR